MPAVEAAYYRPPEEPDQSLECTLCPHRCRILPGGHGLCRVRTNVAGRLTLPYYGCVAALALDPIEKKPLYHFRPGSRVFSAGFVGCNLRCPFCQNWEISQTTTAACRRLEPADLVAEAVKTGAGALAYTYSEPLVHVEFLLAAMAAARREGVANVLVTNGCILEKPAADVLALTDAVNVDLKAGSAETYRRVLGGDLAAVQAFIAQAVGMGVHTEVTTLVVPDLNDSEAELADCADFLGRLDPDLPWHLSAYHPDYRWDAPPTNPADLQRAAERGRSRLRYVYVGNIFGEGSTTLCPRCGTALVSRRGYAVDTAGMVKSAADRDGRFRCRKCGQPVPIRY